MRPGGGPRPAALALLWSLCAVAAPTARADQPDTLTFRSLPEVTLPPSRPSFWGRHRAPLLLTGAGVAAGSLILSQILLREADRRYDSYLQSADPAAIQAYYDDARRLDRWSNALLVVGELSAAASLLLAWHAPDAGSGLSLQPAALPGGAGLRLAWRGP